MNQRTILKYSVIFIFIILVSRCDKLEVTNTKLFNPYHSGAEVSSIKISQQDAFSAIICIDIDRFNKTGDNEQCFDSVIVIRDDTMGRQKIYTYIPAINNQHEDNFNFIDTTIILDSTKYIAYGLLNGEEGFRDSLLKNYEIFLVKKEIEYDKIKGIVTISIGTVDSLEKPENFQSVSVIRTDNQYNRDLSFVSSTGDFTIYDSCMKKTEDFKFLPNTNYSYAIKIQQKKNDEIRSSKEIIADNIELILDNDITIVKSLSYWENRIYFHYDNEWGDSLKKIEIFASADGNAWSEFPDSLIIIENEQKNQMLVSSTIQSERDKNFIDFSPKSVDGGVNYKVKMRCWTDYFYNDIIYDAVLFPIPGFQLIEVRNGPEFTMGNPEAAFNSDSFKVNIENEYWIMMTEFSEDFSNALENISVRQQDIFGSPVSCDYSTAELLIESMKNNAFGFSVFDTMRLPTEAEWEYAASVFFPEQTSPPHIYCWGNDIDFGRCNYSTGRPETTGNYPVGKNRLHDMNGNLSEWIKGFFDANQYVGFDTLSNISNWQTVCQDSTFSGLRSLRGGNYDSKLDEIRNQARAYLCTDPKSQQFYEGCGFRAVIIKN
ncbi:MAG: SUMF1/EgtB/PvdO family nonheme iron enzyme [Bacteroidales bacterium]|nr:SUMF1/EgtB/PvdO family nonheme iron enzyme [Bacteroidales bacterium]